MISTSYLFEGVLRYKEGDSKSNLKTSGTFMSNTKRENGRIKYSGRAITNKLQSKLGGAMRKIGKWTNSQTLRDKGKRLKFDAIKKNQSRIAKNLDSYGVSSKKLNQVKGYADAKKL